VADAASSACWQVHYEGRVQGVGFRYTVRRLATRFDVGGYVRNLPDGRVLLVVEGRPDELARFVAAVAAEMGHCVDQATRTEGPATGEFRQFDIRF
jgi:acylphosphatase